MSAAAAATTAADTKSSSAAAAAGTAVIEGSCKLAEIPIGTVKELKVGEVTILVGQTKTGGYFASGSKCTHYGAPLRTGVLSGDRITCPWHGACFHVQTGAIEDAPAISGLPTYPWSISGDSLVVKVSQTEIDKTGRRPLTGATCDLKADPRVFVVVGGGAAAMSAVETMRTSGFRGRIIMISSDSVLPVDRPMLSKNLNAAATKPETVLLRPASYFSGPAQIDVMLQHEAVSLDSKSKTVTVRDLTKPASDAAATTTVKYDSILIATGASARPLNVPIVVEGGGGASGAAAAGSGGGGAKSSAGAMPSNVYTIRHLSDAAAIFKTVDEDHCAHAVVLGSGFIGLEAAAWLTKQDMTSITVVQRSGPPLEAVFGHKIGSMLQADHTSHNIKFIQSEVKELVVSSGNNRVTAVVLKNGTKLPANVVIVGLGAVLNTGFLAKSDIKLNADGGIAVDQYLETSAGSGIYAAGDIAEYPCTVQTGTRVRIEHYNVAHQHGRIAARNMVAGSGSGAKRHAYSSIPYFWTMQFASIRLCGQSRGYDEIVYDGSVDEKKFVAYYGKAGKVVAVATMGRDPVCSAAAELMREKRLPTIAELKVNPSISLLSLLATLNSAQ